ncbi:MAG: hypothetical protein IH877_09695 [Gemmatimonadetes bacterium]|nr:hypothetical protein [Gemmatimonadota bacterium]
MARPLDCPQKDCIIAHPSPEIASVHRARVQAARVALGSSDLVAPMWVDGEVSGEMDAGTPSPDHADW